VFRFSLYLSKWDIKESPSSWTVSYSDLVTSLHTTVTVEFMTLNLYIFLSTTTRRLADVGFMRRRVYHILGFIQSILR